MVKPFLGACSATETSWRHKNLDASMLLYSLNISSQQQICLSDCAEVQADLHLRCIEYVMNRFLQA